MVRLGLTPVKHAARTVTPYHKLESVLFVVGRVIESGTMPRRRENKQGGMSTTKEA